MSDTEWVEEERGEKECHRTELVVLTIIRTSVAVLGW